MAMFLLAALLASGLVIIADSEDYDATDVSSESELRSILTSTSGDYSVKLTSDITGISSNIEMAGASVKIDLNGHTIGFGSSARLNIYHGDLILEGTGTVEGMINSGVLVVRGSATDNGGYSSLTIGEHVIVKAPNAYGAFITSLNNGSNYGASIDVYGTIDSKYGIYTNGNLKAKSGTIPEINVYPSAEIISTSSDEDDGGAYFAGYGEYNIYGGTISGEGFGIGIKSGILNIYGGIISATGEDSTPTQGYNDGMKASGCAIQIESNNGYVGDVEVNISGGTIGSENSYAIYEYKAQTTPDTKVKSISITGGTFVSGKSILMSTSAEFGSKFTGFIAGGFFNVDPSNYVGSGYEAVLVSGYYYVGEQSTGGDVEVIETETAEDGTEVTTKTDMKVDDSGNVTRATVTVSTDDSVATATIGKSGTTTLSSTTEGTVYLTSESILTIMELSAQISGSDSMALNVVSSGSAVSIGSDAADYVSLGTISLSVTVNSGSSSEVTISLNKNSLEPETAYMLSVEGNSAKASALTSAGLTGLTPFDLGLYVDDVETELAGSVTVSIPVPNGLNNVRLYCLDTKQFFDVVYSNGVVSATLPHFSTWAIVYDKPVVVVDDEDDILFILEQQKKAQEAASAQTTTEDNSGEEAAVIIAAAAVAGAMLACAFFAFRRP